MRNYCLRGIVSRRGHHNIFRYSIKYGFSINGMGTSGWTALHYASHCGNLETIKLLLNAGARIHTRTFRERAGKSALDLAVAAGHEDVVELLMARHCEVCDMGPCGEGYDWDESESESEGLDGGEELSDEA